MLLEEYLEASNISRRTAFYHIATGKLETAKLNGRTYIINPATAPAKKLSKKQKKALLAEIKEKLDHLIYLGDADRPKETIEKIQDEITSYRLMGITFKGYDKADKCDITGYAEKSLYRKITNKRKVKPKTRADKGTIKNEKIARVLYSKIMPIAVHLYFQNAKPNLKDTVDRVLEYAKTNEDLYDVAALAKYKRTLYKVLSREFKDLGLQAKHEYLNHYNTWFKKKAYVTGAFTDDIDFMDYFLGDDNKRNVASAWVYNPKTRKDELKQIKSWSWVEAKTGKVLSYINTTDELTTEDVINTLIEAFQTAGLPNIGIVIDNGIGSSERFKSFFEKLNVGIEQIDGAQNKIKLKLGKPYHATDKAPVERSFGWTKDEFDAFYHNYVGDNHKTEGRHKSNCLTPEKAHKRQPNFLIF